MHRADPRAGQHRKHRFRDQRHIEDDAVALGDAEIGHDGGERLYLLEHLSIGEFRDRVRERRIVDQRHLIGAAVRDMAVERVVAGVDHPSDEPAAIRTRRGIEYFFGRLDPVDLTRGLGPKPFRVSQRAGMDLVIAAVVLNVHGVASRAFMTGHRLFFPFRDTPTLIWIKEKEGIFCPGESLVASSNR